MPWRLGAVPARRGDHSRGVLRGRGVGIELPQTVDLTVVDTCGHQGATASAQLKPATLETGLVVDRAPFVENGDLVRVNTETGEYLSRA